MKVLLMSFIVILMTFCTMAQSKVLVADSGFAAQALKNCRTDLRYLNQVIGWQVKWPRQWQSVVSNGPKDASQAIQTWSQAPAVFNEAIKTLRLGINAEETAPLAVVIRIQQQVRDLLSDLKMVNSIYRFNNSKDSNSEKWNVLINDKVVPAISAYSQFIDKEYFPAARKTPGIYKLKEGTTCFFNAVAWWSTLNISQDEIEAIGNKFLDESRAQLLATGKQGDTVASIFTELRAKTAANKTSAQELISISEMALARAHEKTLLLFSTKVEKEIILAEMPKYMQDSAPAGYYGKAQGKTPARYIINPSRPNERRLMAEVIAFHEGIPGHHLWSVYPREQASKGYNSGILEGWALYSEFLADEINLYSTTYDRQGMIAKHLWAASRLIVEPGIHLRGWSREKAIQFMLENTLISRTEIEIEVDRYIAMPGQSLSYILGADLILNERKRARDILGNTFDITKFHDVILLAGVRSLPQVREDIRTWIKSLK